MENHLAIVSVLTAFESKGGLVLTKKFIDGVIEYCKSWNGTVSVFVRLSKHPSNNLDNVILELDKQPFNLKIIGDTVLEEDLSGVSIVLAALSYKDTHVVNVCKSLNIPCIYITECTLKTELQIIKSSRVNMFLKLRRMLWVVQQNYKQLKALRVADGVQCNGTPTFNLYKSLSKSPMLYFDNRVSRTKIVPDKILVSRLGELHTNKAIRLAFSGRLIEIKGADHLIEVARCLKHRNVEFVFSIFGAGHLESEMHQKIQKYNLVKEVKMCGVLEFYDELLPIIQNSVDLFVCCHRQGDPSCTYIETFACGVPIVGYNNEAFEGILELAEVGKEVKLNDYESLAVEIEQLSKNRKELATLSYNALNFAKDKLFEDNFRDRITHLTCISVITKGNCRTNYRATLS